MADARSRTRLLTRAAGALIVASLGAWTYAAAAPKAAPSEPAARTATAPVAAAKAAAEAKVATPAAPASQWWSPGDGKPFAAETAYPNPYGQLGILNEGGAVTTRGHAFFEPIGTNGRACVSCHQPSDGMALSGASIRRRWEETGGKDPIFAAVDGSNCPSLAQDKKDSHSLLLERGLFRIAMPWPPKRLDGSTVKPDFTIEVVQDPIGCNLDPTYGLKSANPTVSVYRRPRPVSNLKYIVGPDRGIGGGGTFNPKNIAMAMDVDPDTGKPVTMQIMSDARAPTLKYQAIDAARSHLQTANPLTDEQIKQIVGFEMQVYSGQTFAKGGGSLVEEGGPKALGPKNLALSKNGVLGDNFDDPVFYDFNMWKQAKAGEASEQRQFRQSVIRGYDIYFLKPFWIKDSQHINTVGLGNPSKRTCATCHNMQMTGMDLVSGWVDLGTQNLPWADQGLKSPWYEGGPKLPLFKITCNADAAPHMFLGRVIYTHDPGRALVSGRCYDVGSIVMQQFRSLAARAPYFSNGSAKDLRELVDFYDRRFDIGYTEQEKLDLINFLSVL